MPCDRPVNVLLYLLLYYCAKLHLLAVTMPLTNKVSSSSSSSSSKDLNWTPHINNITGKAKNTLRFVKRNIKTSNKKLKKWLIILMSALSSNTVPPSGVPGKKLFRQKLKVSNGQQHVMYATTTTTQAV